MIDSVVLAQHINVTDRQTDSHVAIADVAPTRCNKRASNHRCMDGRTSDCVGVSVDATAVGL